MKFYPGLHHPNHAQHFARCMVSINALRKRKSDFAVREWIMDSGAFTAVARDGGYREPVSAYAKQIDRWAACGELVAAVAQDWMCEPFVLAETGKTVAEHQQLTIERYLELIPLIRTTYIMPVLQGYRPEEYATHVRAYGSALTPNAWVGVGSVCKRNSTPEAIVAVLEAILCVRPDLRLHGFGIKTTALLDPRIRAMLASADSMAWSYAARRQNRDANDWHEAERYIAKVAASLEQPSQPALWCA